MKAEERRNYIPQRDIHPRRSIECVDVAPFGNETNSPTNEEHREKAKIFLNIESKKGGSVADSTYRRIREIPRNDKKEFYKISPVESAIIPIYTCWEKSACGLLIVVQYDYRYSDKFEDIKGVITFSRFLHGES